MKTAVENVNGATENEAKKAAAADTAKLVYKSKLEVEKDKQEIAIAKEIKQAISDRGRLPPNTPAEKWTANMPEHILKDYDKHM